jgi:hypothetical protein
LSENESGKTLVRRMLPRITKALVKGLLYFVLFYALPMFLVRQVSGFAPQLFADYGRLVTLFAAVVIFFAVATELTSGTIYQHALNIGKALILIMFFVLALEGGIMKFDLDIMEGQRIGIVADLRVYLMMLVAVDLLGLAKSVLQTVKFLSDKTEKRMPQLQPQEDL